MSLAIETSGLTRRFGDFTAVDGIDLRVESGKFFGFLGPNGAGKSTTIKMLTGLLSKTSGSATVLGHDLEREPVEIKRMTGVVPEELALFDRLTGREYLQFVGRMYGLEQRVVRSRASDLLELMELHLDDRKLIVDYSHGMKKKVALAAALIHRPRLLFLDEPFEGIDAVASRAIRGLMTSLLSHGVTIFLTSHILEIVEKLCSEVAIIDRGRLVAQGSLAELSRGATLEEIFLRLVESETPNASELSWLA